jgi:hypothetical protein
MFIDRCLSVDFLHFLKFDDLGVILESLSGIALSTKKVKLCENGHSHMDSYPYLTNILGNKKHRD